MRRSNHQSKDRCVIGFKDLRLFSYYEDKEGYQQLRTGEGDGNR